MALIKFANAIALPAPFKAGSCDPIDPRTVVNTKTDITTNADKTFGVVGDYCTIALGLQVYVEDEKATYMYVGPYSAGNGILTTDVKKDANWRKISDANSSSDKIQESIKKINDKINGLDLTDTAVQKSVVTSVSQTDGQISVKRGTITSDDTIVIDDNPDGGINLKVASSALVQYVGENAINISDVDTNNEKTVSLKIVSGDKVLSQDANGLKSTLQLKQLSAAEVTALGDANVKEAYKLVGIDGTTAIGNVIKINKDQTLKEVTYSNQQLHFVYLLADGTESTVDVDMSELITEAEFGVGMEVVDHKAQVKIDAASETFLTVSATGVKLSGVQTAINNTIKTEIEKLDVAAKSEAGKYISTISETDGKIDAVFKQVEASEVSLAEVKNTVDGKEVSLGTDVETVQDGVRKLHELVLNNDKSNAESFKKVKDTLGIVGTDIAYEAKTGDPYIGTATSYSDADAKLSVALKTVSDSAITVKAGNGIDVTGDSTEKTITAKVVSDDPILEVSANGIKTKDIVVLDCGTY